MRLCVAVKEDYIKSVNFNYTISVPGIILILSNYS